MEHLSFENDALELLEACFLGLRPIGFVGERQSGEVQRTQQQEALSSQALPLQSRSLRRQGMTSVREASPLWDEPAAASPDSTERVELLPGQSTLVDARPDAEAISRVIQRDARRYDQQ